MQARGIRRLVVVCAAIGVASATMALAPPAWSSDNVNLASVQPKVPFTVYEPTFTAGLPLLSVKVSAAKNWLSALRLLEKKAILKRMLGITLPKMSKARMKLVLNRSDIY